jgi:predicted PurR-regulated permease PerM
MTENSKEVSSASTTALGGPATIRAAGQVSWAIIGILIITGVLLAGFVYTKSVSVPIVLAIVLAIVFQPAVDWLVKRGMSRAPAAAVVLIGLLVAMVGIVALVAGTLVANWDEISSDLSDAVSKIDDYLSNTSLSNTLGSQASDSAGSAGSTMMSGIGSGVSSVANSTIGVVGGLFFGLWVAFYVLQGTYLEDDESKKLPRVVGRQSGESWPITRVSRFAATTPARPFSECSTEFSLRYRWCCSAYRAPFQWRL